MQSLALHIKLNETKQHFERNLFDSLIGAVVVTLYAVVVLTLLLCAVLPLQCLSTPLFIRVIVMGVLAMWSTLSILLVLVSS